MNKTLYEEALADAKKLRELAEETAKNRVLEAVMPQIRDLVNVRILGEQDIGLDLDEPEDDAEDIGLEDLAGFDEEPESEAGNPVINIDAAGDVNIGLSTEENEEDFVLTDTMAESLAKVIKGEIEYEPTLKEKIDNLTSKVKKLKAVYESVGNNIPKQKRRRLELSFVYCVKEAMNLRGKIILTEQGTQEELEHKLNRIIKEMKLMSRSNRNIFDFLFEDGDKKSKETLEEFDGIMMEQDEDEEEAVDAEEAPEAEAEVDVDVAAATASLEDLGAALGLDVVVGEEDLEGEDELEGEEDLEGEEYELEPAGVEEVYEIDESVLRRELSKMRRARRRRLREQEESVDPGTYEDHGGEEVGDVFYDVDEDDLINALADELGPVDDGEAATVDTVAETRRRRSRRARRPRQNRKTTSRLAETRRAANSYKRAATQYKSQLVEMNLFNAKLLYANKLMQNKNLTVKQQRAIVEALDNAKTLREAKLLYKSLSDSLSRRGRRKKINEGSLRTLGSSSRSTRSAQPASNGVEVDRWGILAGLNGKK